MTPGIAGSVLKGLYGSMVNFKGSLQMNVKEIAGCIHKDRDPFVLTVAYKNWTAAELARYPY